MDSLNNLDEVVYMQLTVNKWGNISVNYSVKTLMSDDIIVNKTPELTVADLFKDYQGKSVNVTPNVFKSTGNEKW